MGNQSRGEGRYTVFVDDNFHHMDEEHRYKLGEFEDCESAIAACVRIVDDFLLANYQAGVASAEALYQQYVSFGEDPFIVPSADCPFSAWEYAKKRCAEICGPVTLGD